MKPRQISYPMLLQAFYDHDVVTVKKYLKKEPRLLDYRDRYDKNNFLHLAVRFGTTEVVAAVLEAITIDKALRLIQQANNEDDTPLHCSARSHPEETTALIIKKLGPTAPTVAKKVNRAGKMPLKLLKKNTYKTASYFKLVEDITYPETDPKLTDKVNIRDVLARYPGINIQLELHFRLACYAINRARELIKLSGTHFSTNNWDQKSKKILDKRINDMRAENKAKFDVISNDQSMNDEEKDAGKRKILLDSAMQTHVGNCSELSRIAALFAKRLLPNIPLVVIHIENGNHYFVVIGISENASMNYKDWNQNVVVCDPWSGKVYKGSEIEVYLNDYWHYRRTNMNILKSFNAQYHILKPLDYPFIYKMKTNPMEDTLDSLTLLFEEEKNTPDQFMARGSKL